MDTYLNDIKDKFGKLCSGREMEVPAFSDDDINGLPNIFELIEFLKMEENKILNQDKGWQNYGFLKDLPNEGLKLSPFPSIYSSDRVYVNNIDDHKCPLKNRNSSLK